jgi:putative glutamine amidotransferase
MLTIGPPRMTRLPTPSSLPATTAACKSLEPFRLLSLRWSRGTTSAASWTQLDGFVLIGGHDLDPRRDGFMLHPSVRTMDRHRETFDRMLIDLIADRRMPVFGIGAGMQLLNVWAGGNLFLHLPEDLPEAIPHKDLQDSGHRHGLEVTPGSLMDRVYGDGEIRVNSMHHMAIDEVAPGFAVTARCPDGVIEAIESESPEWFAFGTQFHPEADSASALDIRIFEEFVDGVRIIVASTTKCGCWWLDQSKPTWLWGGLSFDFPGGKVRPNGWSGWEKWNFDLQFPESR